MSTKYQARSFAGGDVSLWIEQQSSIHLKAASTCGDPAELTAAEAKEIAAALEAAARELEALDSAKTTFQKGDFVEHDGLLAVVVGTPEDGGTPEDHLALWFGEPRCTAISKGGVGGQHPEVWTVPAEYCTSAASSIIRH